MAIVSNPALYMKSAKYIQKQRRILLNTLSSNTPIYHLFDCIEHVSFFAKDREGVLLAANQYLVELYEFRTETELIGHTDFDLLPRRLAEKFRRDDLQIMERRKPVTKIVEIFLNRQGIPSWFITSKYPILSKANQVLGVMGIIQDYHQKPRIILRPAKHGPRDEPSACSISRKVVHPSISRNGRDLVAAI